MQAIFVLIGHFFAASLLTFFVASMLHSQFVLHGLSELGIFISWNDRLSMTWQDMQGLFPTLGPIISLSLLLGFITVSLLRPWLVRHNTPLSLLYPLAGMSAVWLMLVAMQPIMHITVIASARSNAGLFSLCLCGALGGWLFGRLRSEHTLLKAEA
jgi:hypothetical protein